MQAFWYSLISTFKITDAIDILAVAYLLYSVLGFIRDTRAAQLVKGLLIFVAVFFISEFMNLHMLNWLLRGVLTVGLIAAVVVFQPELRRGLEYLGRGRFLRFLSSSNTPDKSKQMIADIVAAVDHCSQTQTGALLVIERETALSDIAESGVEVDAAISAELIGNLFYEGSPLHDGAVIIRGNRIYAAGCVLPLTDNKTLSTELGTRHRAGIGITEHSDALVIIVSEETGIISLAEYGQLLRYVDDKAVEKKLLSIYIEKDSGRKKKKNLFLETFERGVRRAPK